jgi:bifunctional non-homologous end joining protein LigD
VTKERFGPITFESGNRDKILFPESGVTKGDLMDYYRRIGPVMLPHLKRRPVTMQRFPDGISKEGFYQKEMPEYFPGWVDRVEVAVSDGGSKDQVLVNKTASLVYLAEQGCITPHVWLSRASSLGKPDRLVFDLDPADGDFQPVRDAARRIRALLEEMDLPAYLMTTGSRGLHVVTPLSGESDFDTVRQFARDASSFLGKRHPEQLTVETRKEARRGRLFIDYTRNAYGQTTVPPYGVRPLPGAPVAAPLSWDELGRKDLTPQTYTIRNVLKRLADREDPWKGAGRRGHSLKRAIRTLHSLEEAEF